MMAKSGRLTLLKANLASLAVYLMTVHSLPKWVIKRLIQLCHAWLWNGENVCNNGHCRVAWNLLCRPKVLGGLGVMDFAKFGVALRLRWMWLAWQDPTRPWVCGPLPCNSKEEELFAMATEISLGDGARARFWQDRWLKGQCPKVIAPSLFAASTRKNRTGCEALANERWLLDLATGLTADMLHELAALAGLLDDVELRQDQPDTIRWRFASDGKYTAHSAYLIQFEGSIPLNGHQLIWSAWAPGKCRFFIWAVFLGKILTAHALLRWGWENCYFCPLCVRNLETPLHLLVDCPWSRSIWDGIASMANLPSLNTATWSATSAFKDWMLERNALTPPARRKGLISLVHLTAWEIWRERNRRLFQQEAD